MRTWSAPHTAAFLATTLLLAGLASRASAEVIELPAVRDNTLVQTIDGSLSNALGGGLFCGRTAQIPSISIRRGLLAFDVAGNLPAGARIESVELRLFLTDTRVGSHPCGLHRVLADWGEGTSDAGGGGGGVGAPSTPDDATWLHRFWPDDLWTTAGGDFAPAASATLLVGTDAENVWLSTAELVADVQGWLDTPTHNFGWILVGNEATGGTAKRFSSREAVAPSARPVLTIEYRMPTPVPSLGRSAVIWLVLALLTAASVGSWRAARRARALAR